VLGLRVGEGFAEGVDEGVDEGVELRVGDGVLLAEFVFWVGVGFLFASCSLANSET
jgi:hypothetical protein